MAYASSPTLKRESNSSSQSTVALQQRGRGDQFLLQREAASSD